MEKHCTLAQPDGLRYFGPWLRANSKNPVYFNDIISDLNHINSSKTPLGLQLASPITPTSRELISPGPENAKLIQMEKPVRDTTPIHMQGLDSKSNSTPSAGSANGGTTSYPPLVSTSLQKICPTRSLNPTLPRNKSTALNRRSSKSEAARTPL